MSKQRCDWSGDYPLMIDYHDEEWGVPLHEDKKFFEFLLLDSFQAGLSWLTILKKRENFRKAFSNFNYKLIAKYDDKKIELLMNNKGIVRNKLKIQSTIINAQKYLDIQKEYGSFDKYIWSFVDNKPIVNAWNDIAEIPAETELSDRFSKELRKRGFKFVGSTICYAFMQAVGLINDHCTSCYRYKEIIKLK